MLSFVHLLGSFTGLEVFGWCSPVWASSRCVSLLCHTFYVYWYTLPLPAPPRSMQKREALIDHQPSHREEFPSTCLARESEPQLSCFDTSSLSADGLNEREKAPSLCGTPAPFPLPGISYDTHPLLSKLYLNL